VRKGVKFCKYFCTLCGSPVEPMKKDGGWVPRTHAPLEAPNENPAQGHVVNQLYYPRDERHSRSHARGRIPCPSVHGRAVVALRAAES